MMRAPALRVWLTKKEKPMKDRFVSPEKPPEGVDRELLTVLAEELAEIALECSQGAIRISKALRFGLAEVQPGQPFDNAQRIAREVGDLLAVVDRLIDRRVLSESDIILARNGKREKLRRYLQHSE